MDSFCLVIVMWKFCRVLGVETSYSWKMIIQTDMWLEVHENLHEAR